MILLVIIGHLKNIPDGLKRGIFSFHMPLFFLTSGYFIRSYSVKKNFFKALQNLVVPYFAIAGITLLAALVKYQGRDWARIMGIHFQQAFFSLSRSRLLFTDIGGNWLLWFINALFVSRMLYVTLAEIFPAFSWRLCAVLLVSCLGCVLGKAGYYLPWSFDIGMYAVPYLFLGDLMRRKNFYTWAHVRKGWTVAVPLLIWLICFCSNDGFELVLREYGNYSSTLLMSLSGCAAVLGICQILDRSPGPVSKFFQWCGRNSIVILAVHNLEFRYLDWEAVYASLHISSTFPVDMLIHTAAILGVSWIYVQAESLLLKAGRMLRSV